MNEVTERDNIPIVHTECLDRHMFECHTKEKVRDSLIVYVRIMKDLLAATII